MTKHRSYRKGKSRKKSSGKRNVLKRFERIPVLRSLGVWVDGKSNKVTGLPKTPAE